MATAKKLPSGNWRVRLYIGKENGKAVYKSFTAESKKEAEYQALEYSLQRKRKPCDMTVGEAMDKYIESRKPFLSPSSIATYKKLKRNYFADIQPIKLKKLTQDDIQNEINNQAAKLSPKTVKCNHGFLSAVLKEYHEAMVLRTTLPKSKKYIPNIPDAAACKIIINAVKGSNIEIPVLLALWLGMRMSEIRALKWDNIKGNVIYVKEAIVDADNKAVTKSTKSYAGTRTIDMPEYIKSLLDKQPRISEYVVTLKRPTIYDNYINMLSTNGLPHYRFHDLRHANASIMLLMNVPDKYAMERLGHATNNTLKNIYQHTIDTEKRNINKRINSFFDKLANKNNDTKNDTNKAK